MNQKSNIHGVIIGLLVLGLLLTAGGFYFLSKQLNELKGTMERVTMNPATSVPTGGKIAVEKYCDTLVGGTGLCFDYPKGWGVTVHDNPLTSDQKYLSIASLGIRITIEKLYPGQMAMKGSLLVREPRLYELIEMCDGPSCPNEHYFREFSRDQTFAIRVYSDVDARETMRPYIDTILYSLEIKP